MFYIAISLSIAIMIQAVRPDFYTWLGYKARYVRNRFYRGVLKKCPFCKQDLSITSNGRGICTNGDCHR